MTRRAAVHDAAAPHANNQSLLIIPLHFRHIIHLCVRLFRVDKYRHYQCSVLASYYCVSEALITFSYYSITVVRSFLHKAYFVL